MCAKLNEFLKNVLLFCLKFSTGFRLFWNKIFLSLSPAWSWKIENGKLVYLINRSDRLIFVYGVGTDLCSGHFNTWSTVGLEGEGQYRTTHAQWSMYVSSRVELFSFIDPSCNTNGMQVNNQCSHSQYSQQSLKVRGDFWGYW